MGAVSGRQPEPWAASWDTVGPGEERTGARGNLQHATLSGTHGALTGQPGLFLMPHLSVPPTCLRLLLLASILHRGSVYPGARRAQRRSDTGGECVNTARRKEPR